MDLLPGLRRPQDQPPNSALSSQSSDVDISANNPRMHNSNLHHQQPRTNDHERNQRVTQDKSTTIQGPGGHEDPLAASSTQRATELSARQAQQALRDLESSTSPTTPSPSLETITGTNTIVPSIPPGQTQEASQADISMVFYHCQSIKCFSGY